MIKIGNDLYADNNRLIYLQMRIRRLICLVTIRVFVMIETKEYGNIKPEVSYPENEVIFRYKGDLFPTVNYAHIRTTINITRLEVVAQLTCKINEGIDDLINRLSDIRWWQEIKEIDIQMIDVEKWNPALSSLSNITINANTINAGMNVAAGKLSKFSLEYVESGKVEFKIFSHNSSPNKEQTFRIIATEYHRRLE